MPEKTNTEIAAQMPPPNAGKGETLILRDVMAIDRTRLANERTLLAWLRTALMLIVSGVSLIKVFEGTTVLEILGFALIPIGLIAAAYGVLRFLHMCARIEREASN